MFVVHNSNWIGTRRLAPTDRNASYTYVRYLCHDDVNYNNKVYVDVKDNEKQMEWEEEDEEETILWQNLFLKIQI